MTFNVLDYGILIGYMFLILGIGLWVSREKKGEKKNASDYFLAGKGLPWWVIGEKKKEKRRMHQTTS